LKISPESTYPTVAPSSFYSFCSPGIRMHLCWSSDNQYVEVY